jgi:hypothetical protein
VTFVPTCTGRLHIYFCYDKAWNTVYSVRCDKSLFAIQFFLYIYLIWTGWKKMRDEIKYTESVYSLWFPVVAAVRNVVACTARRVRLSLSIL